MRLNRFLALAGLAARRKCDEFIHDGRIEVNGETATRPGIEVDPERARVTCDGERARPPRALQYLAMYKPSGIVVTADDERGRTTVYDILPARLRGRVRAVGRLDRASEGLLLFTNDGILAEALLHPRNQVQRTYIAWVQPPPSGESVYRLRDGVPIGRGERSGKAEVRTISVRGGTARMRVKLREGKNREVRRMFSAVGSQVVALRRVAFDGVELAGMRVSQTRPLTRAEVAVLKKSAGLL